MADVVWPGENAIGKCIQAVARTEPCTTVVGVVDDVHANGIIEAKQLMQLYVPFTQSAVLDSLRVSPRGIERVLLVRTSPGAEAAVMQHALRVLRDRVPEIDVPRANTVDEVLEPKLRPWRLGATLFSALGILAAVVAAIGLYSVIAYAASERAHEMSVRMALGAGADDIVRLVTREGLRVIGISVAIGIGAAMAMGRLVGSLLYGISARDPMVLAGAGVLFTLVGFAAILKPAWRAARNDPAAALRAE